MILYPLDLDLNETLPVFSFSEPYTVRLTPLWWHDSRRATFFILVSFNKKTKLYSIYTDFICTSLLSIWLVDKLDVVW